MENQEKYFERFRKNIVGIDKEILTPYGLKKLVYADWIASGRLYGPIEEKLHKVAGPLVGNTHSESSTTGTAMTRAYEEAQHIIKKHVNAGEDDVLILSGPGMTSAIAKLQRILGLKIPEQAKMYCYTGNGETNMCRQLPEQRKPVVFISHIEHHSNHTSWQETIADVVVIEPSDNLTVDPEALRREIKKYGDRPLKIGSFSACSNVTGYMPPYYELAEIMHENGGYCFVDFAASAPYTDINMHPGNKARQLDAIFFSPHKFLGGPGSPGVLIFNKELYKNVTPDNPGGGTVKWTNRWGGHSYITDIEKKEDGGTPGFLQAMKAALSIKLKEAMDPEKMKIREEELTELTFRELSKIREVHILAEDINERLGVFSFYVEGIHHNLMTILLNDRYGIQARGGCSCAGTYGHYLLKVDFSLSKEITDRIEEGDLSLKPGWIRISLHPTMTTAELLYITGAIKEIVANHTEWEKDYIYNKKTNEFCHKDFCSVVNLDPEKFFIIDEA
ncbi:MAG: aminotransferase class V-fold PLP-dependent enzyme [Bacteroidales bacterium]